MRQLLLGILLSAALAAEIFTPTMMQYGCRSIEAYQRADAAKGYGAQQVFLDAECVYLRDLTLNIAEQKADYLKVCSAKNDHACYWTQDTRPR